MKWSNRILCWLTVLAAIVLLALFIWYVSPNQDSGSDIVSALSILVTILIGWQIGNAVGINRRVEYYDRQLQKIQSRLERTEKLLLDKNDEAVNYYDALIYLHEANREKNRAEQYLKYANALEKLLDAKITNWDLLYFKCAASFDGILHLVENSENEDDIIAFCHYQNTFIMVNTRIVDKLWKRQGNNDINLIEYLAKCRIRRDELFKKYGNKTYSFEKKGA